MKYYELSRYDSAKVTEVEAEKESKSSIWIKGRRYNKGVRYFQTKFAALEWARHEAEIKVSNYKNALHQWNTALGQINSEIKKLKQ